MATTTSKFSGGKVIIGEIEDRTREESETEEFLRDVGITFPSGGGGGVQPEPEPTPETIISSQKTVTDEQLKATQEKAEAQRLAEQERLQDFVTRQGAVNEADITAFTRTEGIDPNKLTAGGRLAIQRKLRGERLTSANLAELRRLRLKGLQERAGVGFRRVGDKVEIDPGERAKLKQFIETQEAQQLEAIRKQQLAEQQITRGELGKDLGRLSEPTTPAESPQPTSKFLNKLDTFVQTQSKRVGNKLESLGKKILKQVDRAEFNRLQVSQTMYERHNEFIKNINQQTEEFNQRFGGKDLSPTEFNFASFEQQRINQLVNEAERNEQLIKQTEKRFEQERRAVPLPERVGTAFTKGVLVAPVTTAAVFAGAAGGDVQLKREVASFFPFTQTFTKEDLKARQEAFLEFRKEPAKEKLDRIKKTVLESKPFESLAGLAGASLFFVGTPEAVRGARRPILTKTTFQPRFKSQDIIQPVIAQGKQIEKGEFVLTSDFPAQFGRIDSDIAKVKRGVGLTLEKSTLPVVGKFGKRLRQKNIPTFVQLSKPSTKLTVGDVITQAGVIRRGATGTRRVGKDITATDIATLTGRTERFDINTQLSKQLQPFERFVLEKGFVQEIGGAKFIGKKGEFFRGELEAERRFRLRKRRKDILEARQFALGRRKTRAVTITQAREIKEVKLKDIDLFATKTAIKEFPPSARRRGRVQTITGITVSKEPIILDELGDITRKTLDKGGIKQLTKVDKQAVKKSITSLKSVQASKILELEKQRKATVSSAASKVKRQITKTESARAVAERLQQPSLTVSAISQPVREQPPAIISQARLRQPAQERFRTLSLERQIPSVLTKASQKALQKSLTKSIEKEIQKPVQKEITKAIQKPLIKQLQKQQQKQIQKQIQKPILKPISPPPPPPGIPRTPQPRLFAGFGFKRKRRGREKKQPSFIVELRRFGKFKPVATDLPKGRAVRAGARAALGGLGATFRLKPTGELTDITDTKYSLSKQIFRKPKAKSRLDKPLTFIQRAKVKGGRLRTEAEKIEIQKARRKRKKKKK